MNEFDLYLNYIGGKNTLLADCYSQLPIMDNPVVGGDSNNNKKRKRNVTPIDFHTIKVLKDDTLIDNEHFFNLEVMCVKNDRINISNNYCHIDEDNDMMDLFLNLLPIGKMHNPINMQNICNHQQQDAKLLQQQQQHNPILYPTQLINGINILLLQSDPTQPTL